jgi:hypothetical protein
MEHDGIQWEVTMAQYMPLIGSNGGGVECGALK